MVTLTKYLNGKPAPADAKENKAALETVEIRKAITNTHHCQRSR
jgi:hypothetical protein